MTTALNYWFMGGIEQAIAKLELNQPEEVKAILKKIHAQLLKCDEITEKE